jgi:hypothetical protein
MSLLRTNAKLGKTASDAPRYLIAGLRWRPMGCRVTKSARVDRPVVRPAVICGSLASV